MSRLISFPALLLMLVTGCSSTEIAVEDMAKRAALLAAKPVLEKIFDAGAPIAPSNRELFPIIQTLPGQPFDPKKSFGNHQHFSKGTVALPPGDYIIPVISYCMKSSGSSPSAHRYQLGKLSGRAVSIIYDLNARALSRFRPEEIQVTSWSIQSGVPFEEMSAESQKIIDAVIPEHRKELEKPFLKDLSEKWDTIAEKMGLPHFNELTDQTLDRLGELGQAISSLKEFRKALKESWGSYESLKSLISLPGNSDTPGTAATTPWSQLSENVYARFLTTGYYLNVGKLEIRVVPSKRVPQATGNRSEKVDIAGLIADPGSTGVQPLSFSPLHASAAIPLLAAADPAIVAAFLAALIASEYTDWDAVGKAIEKWGESTQRELQGLIEKLRQMYTKEFTKPGQVISPPAVPEGFPNLIPDKAKTPRPGGKLRRRWKDAKGNIYEWDYRHGRLEKYDRHGNHQGEFDPKTGNQTKPPDSTRRVKP